MPRLTDETLTMLDPSNCHTIDDRLARVGIALCYEIAALRETISGALEGAAVEAMGEQAVKCEFCNSNEADTKYSHKALGQEPLEIRLCSECRGLVPMAVILNKVAPK